MTAYDAFYRHALRSLYHTAQQEAEHRDYLLRAAWAYPHRERMDRPLRIGWGPAPWSVEDACEFAEVLARRELG